MNAIQTEKKKEKLQLLAKILRDAEKPVSGEELREKLGVAPSTCWRYLKELDAYLEPTEELNEFQQGKQHMFLLVNCAYKYDSKKTEGGYADPTAAKAMDKYTKEDTKVKDWKYNVGEVWYVQNAKSMLDPYLIISVLGDKAIMLRVYEDADIQNKNVDLNDPSLTGLYGKVIDTSFICSKPFKWLTDKATYSFDEDDMKDILSKVARNLHLFEEVFEKKALVEAGQQILELSDKLEKMKQARDEWAKNCQEAEAKAEELRKELALADEARDEWHDKWEETDTELAKWISSAGEKSSNTAERPLDTCTREMYKLKIEMLTEERDRLSALLFASFGVKQ